jgi:uncharacterized Rossmann fold enzyme
MSPQGLRRTNGIALAGLVSCLALAATGCGLIGGGPKPEEQNIVVVLFDKSNSTQSKAVRRRYLDGYKQVLKFFADGAGGILAADVIDENSLLHSSYPVQVKLDKKSIAGKNAYVRKTDIDDKALAPALRIIDAPAEKKGTAILDALTVAERFFDNYPDAEHRYLVIFSDMVEESDHLRFRKDVLTPRGMRAFIARERRDRRLPNLARTEVYVVGAGASVASNMKPETVRKIEEFWLEYFLATGADLPPARYGATLIRFP